MAIKIYYTSKGQPYIKLPSGKARFIKKTKRMSDTGDLGRHRRKSTHRRMAEVSLAELGKLVRAAGKCITIVTGKGTQSYCPSNVSMTKRHKTRK